MTKITFLGACREVGRSAVLIESNNGSQCVLDYGIRFSDEDRLPMNSSLQNLKGVALSHCHIDHSGGLPYLYKDHKVPFFTNPISHRISELLLEDMIRISNHNSPFGYRELEKLRRAAFYLANGYRHKICDDIYITFYNAGHVPGSVSILIEVDKKKILYTGDLNTQITNLIDTPDPKDIPPIDILITESTYSTINHPIRDDLEKEFIDNVLNVVENDGSVLIPAFGVARSQEILMILNKYNIKNNLYFDGLARKTSTIYLEHPEALRNFSAFKKALKNVVFASKRSRKKIINSKKNVIISPSGMLKGGAALEYIQSILTDSDSALFFVGYQVEGTPGRILLDDGIFEYKEKRKNKEYTNNFSINADCTVNYFDFSSHADKTHLHDFVDGLEFIDHNNFIFCVHGDEKSTTSFSRDLIKKDFNSVAPETGEVYKI